MNEKFDHIFRKIAQEHECPFEPAEWENFKKLLGNDVQTSPPTPTSPILSYKNWVKASCLALAIYLIPYSLGNFQQYQQKYFALKNNFYQNISINKNLHKNLTKENTINLGKITVEKENSQSKNELISQSLSNNNSKENLAGETKKIQKNDKNLQEEKESIFVGDLSPMMSVLPKYTKFSLGAKPEFESLSIKNTEIKKSPLVSIKAIATPLNTKHATHNIGLANFSSARGTQIALFTNQNTFVAPPQNAEETPIFQKRKFKAQVSAILNLNSNDYQNLQLSALFNGACHIKGLQMAPINVAGEVEGSQIGMVNVAKKLKGIQFGFINIVDSIGSGIPLGLMSFVKNGGYQKMEISAGDVFQTNLLGKMGVKKFYNIFSVASGYGVAKDFRWALGMGFGTEMNFSKKSAINAEFVAYHVNEQTRFTRELNLLTQLRLQYNFQLFKGTNLYFGPTLNTMFSDFRNPDMTLGSQIAPYVIYQQKFHNSETSMKMWIGGNIGISF